MESLNSLINIFKGFSIFSVIDILVVYFIFYKGYSLIKETRAEQLLKGIILIFLLIPVSDLLNLTMLNWILENTLTISVISIIIIFQPEIRKALEHIGRTSFVDKIIYEDEEIMIGVVNEIVIAVEALAEEKVGALIVIEQMTGLGDIINTGTKINGDVSSALLQNIFVVNTPLHDGATIIRNDKIVAAGCFLPLTNDDKLNKQLGTRHRAGIGVTEVTDCITIIVSEETGVISMALNGRLLRNYDKEKLRNVLLKIMRNRQSNKDSFKERVKLWISKKDKM
ncbi:MAG: diadenylate cyclase CdaA [Clostridium sp.]|uniref:diadenylate cyclase CdaA n=1 Tax=Clostridium culturomicium TaxID=1499683 RepID=UPI00058C4CEC|nr:diadenylate cyclase CdaA [Clostridium culturomicium]MDU4891169.1 diadenylate cyclase CdaA [Clostridium sp.]MDU7085448.1 diadenylate cyclase CdaA [Clostridium sp.]